jgi:hypothetical protein
LSSPRPSLKPETGESLASFIRKAVDLLATKRGEMKGSFMNGFLKGIVVFIGAVVVGIDVASWKDPTLPHIDYANLH